MQYTWCCSSLLEFVTQSSYISNFFNQLPLKMGAEKQFVNPVDAKFTVPDYIVFSLMLGISCGIGIFHALTGGKQKTTLEFLMANRNMNPFPVGMSLVASFISAITFLGTPADNYKYGIGYWLYAFGYILVGLACWRFYIPIFYRMKLTSANEVSVCLFVCLVGFCWVVCCLFSYFVHLFCLFHCLFVFVFYTRFLRLHLSKDLI